MKNVLVKYNVKAINRKNEYQCTINNLNECELLLNDLNEMYDFRPTKKQMEKMELIKNLINGNYKLNFKLITYDVTIIDN